MRTPWLNDLRRASKYASVLGQFVTFQEFFETSDSQGRMSDFKSDGYFSLNLIQSVAREEKNPISRWLNYWDRRRRFEASEWTKNITTLLKSANCSLSKSDDLERLIEEAHTDAEEKVLQQAEEALRLSKEQSRQEFSKLITSQGKLARVY